MRRFCVASVRLDVPNARYILVALICASPAILLADRLDVQAILAGAIAVALCITALTLPSGEAEFLISVTAPIAVLAAVPALWILLQVVPFKPLAHPIWASAQSALARPVLGAISIDPGTSVIRLGEYLVFCGVSVVSAAVAVHRGRAVSVLFALTAAGAIIALLLIVQFLTSGSWLSPFARVQATDCVAIGVVIASAACIRSIERYEKKNQRSQQSIAVALPACIVALVMCAVALLLDGNPQVFVATGCGLAAVVYVVILRRIRVGVWGPLAFAAGLVAFVLVVLTNQPNEHRKSILLAFASSSTAAPTMVTPDVSERVLADAPLVGTGAGTFSALAQIYREINGPPPHSAASTAAATLAIELGRPMLWIVVAVATGLLLAFIGASLQRGRDSFYPAMGGGCALTLILLSFTNAGTLGTATALMAAVVLGLAIGQSKSRTVRR